METDEYISWSLSGSNFEWSFVLALETDMEEEETMVEEKGAATVRRWQAIKYDILRVLGFGCFGF